MRNKRLTANRMKTCVTVANHIVELLGVTQSESFISYRSPTIHRHQLLATFTLLSSQRPLFTFSDKPLGSFLSLKNYHDSGQDPRRLRLVSHPSPHRDLHLQHPNTYPSKPYPFTLDP